MTSDTTVMCIHLPITSVIIVRCKHFSIASIISVKSKQKVAESNNKNLTGHENSK